MWIPFKAALWRQLAARRATLGGTDTAGRALGHLPVLVLAVWVPYSYGIRFYGPYGYGLCSYGLYTYGLHSCGRPSSGTYVLCRYGLYSYGLHSYGRPSSGTYVRSHASPSEYFPMGRAR